MAGSFFTVGRDGQLVILHALAPGGRIDAPLMTDFDAKPNPVTLKSVGLDGKHREDYLPGNWTLTIKYDRAGSTLDDFQSLLDIAKRNAARVPVGTIYQYVNELDGSVSTYSYSEVTFQVTDLGNFKGDDKVSQTLKASAVARTRV